MTDSSHSAIDTHAVNVNDSPMFYVVSKRKFTILYLATLGMYSLYWFYKNWDSYKDKWPYASKVGSTIWPVPRALFAIFFVHSLFRKIKENAVDQPVVAAWSNSIHASWLAFGLLISTVLNRVSAQSVGSPYTDVLSLAMVVPLVFLFIKAQQMINITCGDREGECNDNISGVNIAWIVVGVLMWILVLFGLFIPDQTTSDLNVF